MVIWREDDWLSDESIFMALDRMHHRCLSRRRLVVMDNTNTTEELRDGSDSILAIVHKRS